MDCPSCRAVIPAAPAECPSCGLIFAKWAERLAREDEEKLRAVPVPAAAEPTLREQVFLPAAVFAAAGILAYTGLGRFLIHSALAMQFHELGHAVASWLGGRLAVPLPLITLSFSDERSVLFALAFAAALAWLLKTALDEGCRALAGLCAVLLALQAWMTVVMPSYKLDFWVAFGGLGGECVVSALLVALYFHPLPRAARWPSYRSIFLFLGACVLAASLRRWHDADRDFMNVPWGSFWGGDGDVEVMLAGGWTVNRLVQVYLRLAWVCAAAAVLEYGRAVWSVRAGLAALLARARR